MVHARARPTLVAAGFVPVSLFLVASVALHGACHAPHPSGSATGTVRALIPQAPNSLTIIGKGDRYSILIGRLLSDSLVHYDASLALRPGLAESWQVSEDGRTVTFRLRPGVRWHDGLPVTARDVVFTIRKVRDPATEARSYAPQFDHLEQLEAADERTVTARYSVPYADFLAAWWVPIIPEHAVASDEDFLSGPFSQSPVGCGPFRLARYDPDRRIELEANPDYWAGPPAIRRLVLEILPDAHTAYQALLRGEIDLMAATPDLYEEARRADRPLGRLVYYRLNVWYLGLNQDGSNALFLDPRVRRALVLGLDREGFATKLTGGLARPATTSYHPQSPWADPALPPLPYDPREAARLLEEAGWRDGDGNGVRERDGRPFRFTLLTTASTEEITDRMAAWIQQSLAEIGVRMEIEPLEWKAFQERREAGRFEAFMSGQAFDAIPDQFELYHSTATARNGGFNYVAFRDPEVDRLVEQGRTTFDAEARRGIYHRLQARLRELQPISPLFHFASPVLHDARLAGIEPSALDHWRIKPGPAGWHWVEGS